ncbi:MAG: heparinase II/III family protein, partial [FCB group bacterium]|nr:heparinase II/III family protein [FCB group bacterium]
MMVRGLAGTLLLALLITARVAAAENKPEAVLKSLAPEDVLAVLDLSSPGLEEARAAADKGDRAEALAALLKHYRKQFPANTPEATLSSKTRHTADDIVNHVFQWGPYEPAEYCKDVNWEADPRGDIEWVAAMYRFHWAEPLAEAYGHTKDEKYAQAFVDLSSDWIAKHPLEKADRVHPIYAHWKGFAWLDIQTGRRARSLCRAFPSLLHSQAFTPEFLGMLLASLYDHQVKTEAAPRAPAHNKAVFEQRGFVEVATAFPEFKDSRRWLELALERTRISLMSQTTEDGVQREWATGYHRGVLEDAVWVFQKVEKAGIPIPQDCRDRTRRMADCLFAVATPDLGYPMFGDAGR